MKYIEIEGYKSIRKARIELNPINILIGSNGAGKSNFLSFFEFLNNLYERKLREYVALRGGVDKMLYQGSEVTNAIYARIQFDSNAYAFELTKSKTGVGFVFTKEELWHDKDPGSNKPTDISDYRTEAGIKTSNSTLAGDLRGHMNSFKKYHFHDTGENSPFNKLSHIQNDIYFLYDKGENLAAFLFNIQNQDRLFYNRIVSTIQSIAPYFSDFYFQPNKEGYIQLQWQDKHSSTIYGGSDLSDGTIRFIALAALFLQPELPSAIIIDEPELGLHPYAISMLAEMIKFAAKKNTQVIVATQSADLLNHFETKDVITVDQHNGESIFRRLSEKNYDLWLDDYKLGDLWQQNIIQGGQPM
jgi:predicted ATPase